MKHPPVHYSDYLDLEQLTNLQHPKSTAAGHPAHDEMLFIIVHQTYELWFKQILFELDSILDVFGQDQIPEKQMGRAIQRLERIRDIQAYVTGQIDILETMTPMDFLDFRDYLYPASGFQSFQWRLIETKLGLPIENRLSFNDSPFWKSLHPSQHQEMQKVMDAPSLFDRLQSWLERTPFLSRDKYDFWTSYQKSVLDHLSEDEAVIREHTRLGPNEKERSFKMIEATRASFLNLFDNEKFETLRSQGAFRFSNKALQAALFIQLYRDEPILQLPHRVIAVLIDLDEKMTEWRYRHSLMAARMLGKKIGTGGSVGADYLKAATEKHKIFGDLVNLASFLIPRSRLPELPESVRRQMNFQ